MSKKRNRKSVSLAATKTVYLVTNVKIHVPMQDFNAETPQRRDVDFAWRLKNAGNVKRILSLQQRAAGELAPGVRWLYFIEACDDEVMATPSPRWVIGHADPLMLTATLVFRTNDRAAADRTWADLTDRTRTTKPTPSDVIDI